MKIWCEIMDNEKIKKLINSVELSLADIKQIMRDKIENELPDIRDETFHDEIVRMIEEENQDFEVPGFEDFNIDC